MQSAIDVSENDIVEQTELQSICRRHRVKSLALFGSRLNHRAHHDSDIDLLVEFEPGYAPGLSFFKLQDELTEVFGKVVDLNTRGFLSRYFRHEVAQEAKVIYVA